VLYGENKGKKNGRGEGDLRKGRRAGEDEKIQGKGTTRSNAVFIGRGVLQRGQAAFL